MALKMINKPIVLPKLKTLLESPNSCVSCIKNYKMGLVISASNLGQLKETVHEVLSSKITFYDSELDGVIVGHKNVKLLDSIPMDFDETRIYYQADVYLFQIKVGSILCGVVNKKSRDYVGVLVHCVFNAALHRPGWEEGCPKVWPGSHLSVGQEISFEVTFINFSSRPPLIMGKLIDTYQEDVDSGIGGLESMEDESHDEAMKKKKKKKKSLVDIGPDSHIDDDRDTSSVIKALSVFEESSIDTIATTEATSLNEEDSPKKSKKRKRLSEGQGPGSVADTSVTLTEEEAPPKKKKKKKSVDDSRSLIDQLIKKEMDSINTLEDSAVNKDDESRVHNEEETSFTTEERKKKKKRKKCEDMNVSSTSLVDELVHNRRESLNMSSVLRRKEEDLDNESSSPSGKHKTKRKSKHKDKEVSPEEIPDQNDSMFKSTDQLNESTTKLKKRKSSIQDLASSLLNEALAGLK